MPRTINVKVRIESILNLTCKFYEHMKKTYFFMTKRRTHRCINMEIAATSSQNICSV